MIIHPFYYFILNEEMRLENELFLPVTENSVKGIKPQYFISNHGRFYSDFSKRLMHSSESNSSNRRTGGYLVTTLQTYYGPVTVQNHRVEMMEFKYEPGCEELTIDHIDTKKMNNYISNLEWVSISENTKRAAANGLLLTGEECSWTKVTDNQIREICELYISGKGISEIARIIGCGIDSVFCAVHGQNRTDITSQYDIESRYRGYFTDEQIHTICKIYESFKGIKYPDIKKYIIATLHIGINRLEDSILRNLYRKDLYCYYRISSKYDY